MSKNTLYMETTSISPEATAGQIVSLLVACGATQVNMAYAAGKITGLRWCFRINGREQLFDMPVRVDAIRDALKKRGRLPNSDPGKAERVAWRQLFRWIESDRKSVV